MEERSERSGVVENKSVTSVNFKLLKDISESVEEDQTRMTQKMHQRKSRTKSLSIPKRSALLKFKQEWSSASDTCDTSNSTASYRSRDNKPVKSESAIRKNRNEESISSITLTDLALELSDHLSSFDINCDTPNSSSSLNTREINSFKLDREPRKEDDTRASSLSNLALELSNHVDKFDRSSTNSERLNRKRASSFDGISKI